MDKRKRAIAHKPHYKNGRSEFRFSRKASSVSRRGTLKNNPLSIICFSYCSGKLHKTANIKEMSKPSLMITHQVAVFLSHHVDYLGEINGGLMDTLVRNCVHYRNI